MANNYNGTSAGNGKDLGGAAHLRQSIRDILCTRLNTRLMLRQYGSRLPELVDNPLNELTKVELFAATAEALEKWEPRFRLDRVYVQSVSDAGQIVIALEGRVLLNNEPITLEGIEIN
jgi:phage baseplate assembly protein W